jgi:hypothetical protein
MMQKTLIGLAMSALLAQFAGPAAANAAQVVVGINMTNPNRLSVADQNTMLDAMQAAGVRVIRCGIENDDKGVDFAKRVYARGMQIEWIVGFGGYFPGAPTRAYQPAAYPAMWSGHPLSSADPAQFRTYFQAMLDKLEAQGITLAAFELGNEINWTAFNPDFPLPGEGKGVLSFDDLYHDPEGQQIAKGYLQYLKDLAVLKDIRDRSKLNQHTPVLTAGLVDAEQGDVKPGSKVDSVSFSATIDFLRANGLDALVDGYGIHIYPNSNAKTPADRRMHPLEQTTFAEECQPAGSAVGKPCWVTEWGIPNTDVTCPPDEDNRTLVVRQMLGIFRSYAQEGRLGGLFLFTWNSDPWAKTIDRMSVYRCGELTPAGRLAISPL